MTTFLEQPVAEVALPVFVESQPMTICNRNFFNEAVPITGRHRQYINCYFYECDCLLVPGEDVSVEFGEGCVIEGGPLAHDIAAIIARGIRG